LVVVLVALGLLCVVLAIEFCVLAQYLLL